MASSSTSSLPKRFKYDVFLSFRGEDIRKTFIDHLYASLKQQGIFTFKDDKRLEKGERIDNELIKSIQDSKFFIIVFSQNYASSSWCLNELVEIMECQKNTEQIAYPVFYDVDPSEVRKQRESYGEALAKYNKEDAHKWSNVLLEAGSLSGYDVRNTADGHEAEVIKEIVVGISNRLRSTYYLSRDENLVGMETRILHLLSCLDIGSDDVRMLGIKGMGGSGKTTLARAIFQRISIHFDGASFVDNVREKSKASESGLQSLQNKILSNVLKEPVFDTSSFLDGELMMRNKLRGIKVLIVLDDVDDSSQLEALVGASYWFKRGSRIIITTRDEQVLHAHGVEVMHVNLLSQEESICLFNRYAFKGDILVEGQKKHVSEVVGYAGGLPLTLKVLGSLLYGKSESVWTDVLKRLKTIPLKQTMDILELSYISLEDDHKELFLDVVCLLKGWRKTEAIRILESRGFYARYGLTVLEQKSLITFTQNYSNDVTNIVDYMEDGDEMYLDMHDHIQEMGQNIVRRKHPNEPNKHSRLWIDEETKNVLINKLGTEATTCIRLTTPGIHRQVIMDGLKGMNNLKMLHVEAYEFDVTSDQKFDEKRKDLPNALQYLYWKSYPFCSLPKRFHGNNLVTLEIQYSNIKQLWEKGESKVLHNLKFLDLSHSALTKLDLSLTPHLEVLILHDCCNLLEVVMSGGYPKLRSLQIGDSKLRKLDLSLTPNLMTLHLLSCLNLVELNMPVKFLKLKYLNLTSSLLTELDLGITPDLEELILDHCPVLVLQMRIECLKLRDLVISLSSFKTLELGLFPNLKKLCLDCDSYDLLEEPHIRIACRKLETLVIKGLQSSTLDLRLCPDLTFCKISHSKLKTFDLALTPKLKSLSFIDCHDLVELRTRVGCLKELADMLLLGCSRLRSFVLTNEQETLELCPSVDSNHGIPKILVSCFYKEQASESPGSCRCSNLENILETSDWFPYLKKVILGCGTIREMPEDSDHELEYTEEPKSSRTWITYIILYLLFSSFFGYLLA